MSFSSSNVLGKYLYRGGTILERCKGMSMPVCAGALMLAASAASANDNGNTPMTAGVVVEKMESNEFFFYVSGIIEGLAYARFQRDTNAAGTKTVSGMHCMQQWYRGKPELFLTIDATFRKYADLAPVTVLAAMLKKECGE